MTVPSATLPRMDYTGNGSLTVYPYAFPIFASADLTVYVGGVLQALTTQYTVSGAGNPGGGNVTFGAAPANGVAVSILRSVQAVQGTDLRENDPQPAETLEAGLDRPIMLIQQTQETLGRAPQFSPFSVYKNALLDDPIVGNVLRTKSLSPLEFEWAAVVAGGLTLPLAVNQGGTGGVTALAARQGLGLDGQEPRQFTNKTGGTVVAGDVLAIDSATDSGAVLGDTVNSLQRYVVVLDASLATNATGSMLLRGVALGNTQGAIVRGHYVVKSATAKKVQDSGTAMGAAVSIPSGALGVALTADSAGQALIDWFGMIATSAPPVAGGYGVRGLVGGNNAGTPTTKYDLTSADVIQLRNPTTGGIRIVTALGAVTNDVTVAQATNGRDQAGAFSASSWVHVYYVGTGTGSATTLSSATAPPTGPALLAGQTEWAYAGAVRFNASSQLIPTLLRGSAAFYSAAQVALTAGTAAVETAVSLGSLVPPNCSRALLEAFLFSGNANGVAKLRVVTAQDFWTFTVQTTGTIADSKAGAVPNVNQQVFYLVTTTLNAPSFTINVNGYTVPNGDS